MNDTDKILQKQIMDLSEKLNTHIISRHDNDKHLAVSLQRIEDTMRSVEEQVKKTNGRVTTHDVQFTDLLPKMNILYLAHMDGIASKEKNRGKWVDYLTRMAIVIVGIVLMKLEIISFNLPI